MGEHGKETAPVRLSYKFQRLRERLRDSVVRGELSGKLPGERSLAKRFNVNAKTLSKALTDLAAEGLLERTIGRGTFVRGSTVQVQVHEPGRWLILCEPQDENSELVQRLAAACPGSRISCDLSQVRPSFLNQFGAVIDVAASTPEAFLRDLVVRNIPVVAVGREPRTYSMHSVLLDEPLALTQVVRELLLEGHRKFLALEPRGSTAVIEAIRRTAARYGEEITADACAPEEIGSAAATDATALVCNSCTTGRQVMESLARLKVSVPQKFSVGAVGNACDAIPCTGFYAMPQELADGVVQLLRQTQTHRPITLWLAGHLVNRGTTGNIESPDEHRPGMPIAGLAI